MYSVRIVHCFLPVTLQELTNDKEALQKQVYENLHQISQLKTQLDEYKHRFDIGSSAHIDDLRRQLEDEREAVERKEKEVSFVKNAPLADMNRRSAEFIHLIQC